MVIVTRDTPRPAADIDLRADNSGKAVVVNGDLVLKEKITHLKCDSLTVEGDVIGSNAGHSLSVSGDLKVLGNLRCKCVNAGGIVEVTGATDVERMNSRTFDGQDIVANSINAWTIHAGNIKVNRLDTAFVFCEDIKVKKIVAAYRIVKGKSRYTGEGDSDIRKEDIVFLHR